MDAKNGGGGVCRVRRDLAAPGWLVLQANDGSALLLTEAEAASAVAALLQVEAVRQQLTDRGESCELVTSSRAGVVVATVRLQ